MEQLEVAAKETVNVCPVQTVRVVMCLTLFTGRENTAVCVVYFAVTCLKCWLNYKGVCVSAVYTQTQEDKGRSVRAVK